MVKGVGYKFINRRQTQTIWNDCLQFPKCKLTCKGVTLYIHSITVIEMTDNKNAYDMYTKVDIL